MRSKHCRGQQRILKVNEMEKNGYTEADWKLFRARIGGWQEAYMERLIKEYEAILSGEGNPSDKFWKLERRIREDKRSPGVQLEMKRSRLRFNLLLLLNDGVISLDDLNEFSDELKESMYFRQ